MSNTNASQSFGMSWKITIVVALIGYAMFIAKSFAPVAGGSDTSGYMNLAKGVTGAELIIPERLPGEIVPEGPFHFTPLGYVPAPDPGLLSPSYPVGLPVHIALGVTIAGWSAGPVLVGVMGVICAVVLVYACARELELSAPTSVVCAASLAAGPVFIFVSIQPLSGTIATTWILAAVWCALRSRKVEGWAFGCGAAVAIAVAVRPANVIVIPALILLLFDWSLLWRAAVTGAPGAIVLGLMNNHLYGNPLSTGYGDPELLFGIEWVAITLSHYAHWMPRVFPIALIAIIALPFLPWRRRRRELSALLAWSGAFAGFHAFYVVTHTTWWSLRFLLPAFSAVALISGIGVDALAGRLRDGTRRVSMKVSACSLIVVVLFFGYRETRHLDVLSVRYNEFRHLFGASWANENIPKDALVACLQVSGSLYFYTDLPIMRYDMLGDGDFDRYAAAMKKMGRPIFAVLFRYEEEEALQRRMPGQWKKLVEKNEVSTWRYLGPDESQQGFAN